MLERFSESTREAVVLAADEARLLGHDHIGTEHLLLGLVRQGDPAVQRLGLTLTAARTDVRVALGPGSGKRTIGELRFTHAARRVLDQADAEGGNGRVEPADLLGLLLDHEGAGAAAVAGREGDDGDVLLALARDRDGIAGQALRNLGVDYERLQRAIELIRRR